MAYTGDSPADFANAVTALTTLTPTVFPQILKKNAQGTAYSGINETFPRVITANIPDANVDSQAKDRENAIIQNAKTILQATEFINVNYGDIEIDNAARAEKSALDAYDVIQPYMKILGQRLVVNEAYMKAEDAFTVVKENELSMETQFSLLQFLSSNTEDEKQTYRREILAASESYLTAKREQKQSQKEFVSLSRALSRLEKKDFNPQFSPHKFINAVLSTKDEYYQTQEKGWGMILNRITAAPLPEQVANNQPYQNEDLAGVGIRPG